MRSPAAIAAGLITAAMMAAPAAHAAPENVTYEIVSPNVPALDVQYFDGVSRQRIQNVALPWRMTVSMENPRSVALDGAEVRADWRRLIAAPVWQPGKWVTVRIYIGDTLQCQNTLDVGNAACYGSTSFKS